MVRRLGVVIVLAICAFAAVLAQTLPAGVVKKASMGGITEYGFPNGLRVLLYPDPADPKITVNVTYLVGSRHEGYGETGMAHLLEHMNFIETTNGRQIKDETRRRTGRAGTGRPSTTARTTTRPSPRPTTTCAGRSDSRRDRMVNVKFTKEILDTEMTVVRNEFERGENSPAVDPARARRVHRVPLAQLRKVDHRLEGRSREGAGQSARGVLQEVLSAGQRGARHHRPSGRSRRRCRSVAESMGKLPRPARVLDQTYTVEPPQDGERFVALRRVGQGQNVMIAYHAVAAGASGRGGAAGACGSHERRWRRTWRTRRWRRRRKGDWRRRSWTRSSRSRRA